MFERDDDGNEVVRITTRGRDVLNDNLTNRGTAFTHAERDALSITGLLPTGVSSLEEQVQRADEIERGVDAELQAQEA